MGNGFFEWEKKKGENWHQLKVELDSLNLDQSLKVQEMFDNKSHQKLQEKFNKIIIFLTGFIVLGGVFEFSIIALKHFEFDLTPWFVFFGLSYLILALAFLYFSFRISIQNSLKGIVSGGVMEICKKIVALVIFVVMTYVSFEISLLFGTFFLAGGVYALTVHDAWERPGIPILWLMGGLVSRVALTDMLIPILRYESLVDIVILLLASGAVYLIGYKIKKG